MPYAQDDILFECSKLYYPDTWGAMVERACRLLPYTRLVVRDRVRQWRALNRLRDRENNRRYREENREFLCARDRARRLARKADHGTVNQLGSDVVDARIR